MDRPEPDREPFRVFDDPALRWHAAFRDRGIDIEKMTWSDLGGAPVMVAFRVDRRPCFINGQFQLPLTKIDPYVLGTLRGRIDGVSFPEGIVWAYDVSGSAEGCVSVGDQEWNVKKHRGGAREAAAFLGVEPEAALDRLIAAVLAFNGKSGTVSPRVPASVRGTSRVFRRKFVGLDGGSR